MDQPSQSLPFWESVRAWADSAGLLLPQESTSEGESVRPPVPPSVCENCPICQGAATLDQINPQVIDELSVLARGVFDGIASALASASEQRHTAQGSTVDSTTPPEPAEAADDAGGEVTDDSGAGSAEDPSGEPPAEGDPEA
jgi:hypothetical protein